MVGGNLGVNIFKHWLLPVLQGAEPDGPLALT